MKVVIQNFNKLFDYDDLGKAILRISFGFMFLLHGIHKIFDGTAFIQGLFVDRGLPGFFAYGVYLGEVVVPILIILGLLTRISSIIWIGTSVVVVILMHSDNLFALNKVGAWVAEGIGVYLFAAITLLLTGAGKYSLDAKYRL